MQLYHFEFVYPSRIDVPSGVHPVINLKADTQFTGTGTSANPYQVVNE